MKQLSRGLRRIILLLALAWVPVACETMDSGGGSGPQGAAVPAPNVLRIGVTPNAEPMIFKRGGQIVGLEADLGRALAAELGKSPQFVELPFDSLIPALEQNRIDIIMSAMSITPERSARVAFSKPYLGVGQTLLVRNEDLYTYEYPKVILAIETRIGVEKGTTSDVFVQRYCPKATRVTYASPQDAIAPLKRGSIDVFMHDAPVIWQLAAENTTSGLSAVRRQVTQEFLGWGVRKGNYQLLDSVNGVLSGWKNNARLDGFVDMWIPIP